MGEQQQNTAKLVIVYFANGTKQWVKNGTTNQWAKEGGQVFKFYEGKVYSTSTGRKVKVKQHFKLLNAVLMDIETGEFLPTERPQLLDLQLPNQESLPTSKWWEVDWQCEIVFEKKEDHPERREAKLPYKESPKVEKPSSAAPASSSIANSAP